MSDFPLHPVEVPAPRLVKRPKGLLLDVAEDIAADSRIIGGMTFCPQGCANLDTFENSWCTEITLPDAGPVTLAAESWGSFTVVGREDAPAWFGLELARDRITQRFDTQISAQVARELLTGANTGNPSLQSEASVVIGALTPVEDVLFVINEELAAVDNAVGSIFATPGTFELLINAYDVDETNGVYTTATGHFLVGDSGFDGAGPNDEAGTWVYAIVGKPIYWLGPRKRVGDETANFTMSKNKRSTVYTQDALVGFENCLVIAVNVDVPTYTVGS